MRKGQIYVRAKLPDGNWGACDILELTDESFRAFVVDHLLSAGLIVAIKDEYAKESVVMLADPDKYSIDKSD
jgi:hypothetical protein